MFANCFATDNMTALNANGDRMLPTMRTALIVRNDDFADQPAQSFKGLNDALATLQKAVKFAVVCIKGSNNASELVNSLKQRK